MAALRLLSVAVVLSVFASIAMSQPCGVIKTAIMTTCGIPGKFDPTKYNLISFDGTQIGVLSQGANIDGGVLSGGFLLVGSGFSIGDTFGPIVPNRLDSFPLITRSGLLGTGAVFPDAGKILSQNITLAPLEADLAARVVHCNGCVDSLVANLTACFTAASNEAAAFLPNTQATLRYGTLRLRCPPNQGSNVHILALSAATISQTSAWDLGNCNTTNGFLINILGSGPVTFGANGFPTVSGGVLFNTNTPRILTVDGTLLNGSILAPRAILNQVGGQINGEVIVAGVANANSLSPESCR